MSGKLEGVIVWFLNLYPDTGQSVETTMRSVKEMNQPLMQSMSEDGRYVCLLIPTTKEATRVVKVDYDAPFPRYMPRSADVNKLGLPSNEKKPKKTFAQQDDYVFNGLINLFINFHPEVKFEVDEVLSVIKEVNKEAFDLISKDGRYQIMIVPTTKEASRIEKVDFDMPFPRLTSEGKSNTNNISKIVKEMIEANKENKELDDKYDEIKDEDLEEEKD